MIDNEDVIVNKKFVNIKIGEPLEQLIVLGTCLEVMEKLVLGEALRKLRSGDLFWAGRDSGTIDCAWKALGALCLGGAFRSVLRLWNH